MVVSGLPYGREGVDDVDVDGRRGWSGWSSATGRQRRQAVQARVEVVEDEDGEARGRMQVPCDAMRCEWWRASRAWWASRCSRAIVQGF